MQTALIILAAGKGSRMQSDMPKVLHKIGGVPMLSHVMRTAAALEPSKTVIVTGHGAAEVEATARADATEALFAHQAEQRGTGHAVQQAHAALSDFDGLGLVLYGDTPFVREDTLHKMLETARHHDVVVLGFEPADPGRYGRLVVEDGVFQRIVEYKDATEAERAIGLCNGGLMACPIPLLFDLLAELSDDNAAGEFYLTDIVEVARRKGLSAGIATCTEDETIGINTRAQLAQAEAYFQATARAVHLDLGVTMQAPETVFFAHDTVIGRDAEIEPNVVFGPGVTVESGAQIRAFSHLEGCHVARGAVVGPYARLRPGAELAEDVRIGNFVEIKNALIDAGAKINHLSYVGDAQVGARTNIGAGTITCNYDGVMKHRTEIGQDAFIGSNTMLVAPVQVGDGAVTGSGSVITNDVPADAIALARAAQTNRPGMSRKLFEMLRRKKARRDKSSGSEG